MCGHHHHGNPEMTMMVVSSSTWPLRDPVLDVVGSMLSQGLSVLYSTHVLLESMNLGIVVMVGTMSIHAMVLAARALYGTNLYLELVWLLAPTAIVVLLIVRTIAMQCSDEELCSYHS